MCWRRRARKVQSIRLGEDESRERFSIVLAKFDEHFKGKKRLVFCRYQLWSYQRSEGHEFIDYFTNLQELANQCEFAEKENMIRDKLIFSMSDRELKEQLLGIASLSLENVKDKIIAAETTRYEIKLMSSDVRAEKRIEAVRKQRQKPHSIANQLSRSGDDTKNCSNCGSKHPPKSCPAYGKECHRCHKKNHFAKYCRGVRKRTAAVTMVTRQDEENDSNDGVFFLGGLESERNDHTSASVWWGEVKLNSFAVKFKIDTGAEVNLISRDQWNILPNRSPLKASKAVLKTLNGGKLRNIGCADVQFSIKEVKVQGEIFVIEDKTCPILGLQTAIQLGLIKKGAMQVLQ